MIWTPNKITLPIWRWQNEKKLAPRAGSNCVQEIHSFEGQA